MSDEEPQEISQESWRALSKRRGYLTLDPEMLLRMMGIPEDVFLLGLETDQPGHQIRLYVASERLPQIEPGTESPNLSRNASIEVRDDEDGTRWHRIVIPDL